MESRHDHRLYDVLLAGHDMTCPEGGAVGRRTGKPVEYWIRRFEDKGLPHCARVNSRGGRDS